ncbi:AAA family ATPase [Clostridium sp.]|uniref:AAA family ATPase n=1 Tax=Clostridium sp. TaxID=1506 RepID=UPI0025C0308D|nr:AAA family ATPase [Clostridium sp.]
MIKEILLNNVATYKNDYLEPNKINYLYGSNGSGKTTISRVVSNPKKFQESDIIWNNEELNTIVYNKDFIDENFSNSESIKGIFTLGKDTKEAKEAIEAFKSRIDKINTDIEKYNNVYKNTIKEIETLEDNFLEKCWQQKKNYENSYKEALSGYIGKKVIFMRKCLDEYSEKEIAVDLETLDNKYTMLFKKDIKVYDIIPEIDLKQIKEKEVSTILDTIIVGKKTSLFSNLITKLQNSDWIKEGIEYLNKSERKCPFCQQVYNDSLINEIENYFDKTYEDNCNILKNFKDEYEEYFKSKILELNKIVNTNFDILDLSKLKELIMKIDECINKNINLIQSKLEKPSIPIKIQSIEELFLETIEIIREYNVKIKDNNNLVNNISNEKEKLKKKVWNIIVNNLADDIDLFNKRYSNLLKRKEGVKKSIEKGKIEIKKYEEYIKDKECEITSVVPTVNEINKILLNFGFNGFKLDQGKEKGEYKLIRNDGTNVDETLSEGEYRFITFLYFYQLIKGSNEVSGITKDKVVFIDDPISSLDSNVLFIVSNLVKNIIKDCIDNKDGIKQVFVSTHNLYFYKEIIYRGSRESKTKDETYWIIRKKDEISSIHKYENNPVQTTYELLWRELDNPSKSSKANIFNNLRRILEYYFNILGGLNYEKCINEFEGEERLLCKSLISFINDGSHFISDDLVLCIESDDIEKYLKVFKLIFIKMGHESHYNMMMKSS